MSNKPKESKGNSSKSAAAAAAAAGAAVEHLESQVGEGEIKEIDFPFNNRTYESYVKQGLQPPRPIDLSQEKVFLQLVNLEEGRTIERVVTRIVRSRERDWSTGNKISWKEYLVWYENWYGKNWLNEMLPPVSDHLQGAYMHQDVTTTRERDMKTGQLGPAKTKRVGEHIVYYVPFTKEKVKEIIGSQDPEGITYVVKFPRESIQSGGYGGSNIRNTFSLQQFLLPLDELYRINASVGGPIFPQKSANSLTFQPG
jgi:hypothetical protein